MGTFKVGGRAVRYAVRENSSSKYLILNLRKDRTLEISFPRNSGISVKKVLEKKRPWIERKYKELSGRKRLFGNKKVLYRGYVYNLKIVRKGEQKVRIHRDEITVTVKGGQSAREVLKEWMAQKSKKYAVGKAMEFAKLLGIDLDLTVDVKDMKSWGRCVGKKRLVFNWQLTALPARLAEYVVSHELTHLAEESHSKRFERKLVAICPRHKELREELKSYSP